MSKVVKLRRGFDIRIKGAAEKILAEAAIPVKYGVKPVDFPGLIPKLDVKPGEKVKAGSPLFHDKNNPAILFTSPVSGTVLSVERGERRRVLEVTVAMEGDDRVNFGKADPLALSRDKIKEILLASGLWPAIRQRPYNVVASPSDVPKSIFISGFDSAPMAPDYNFIMRNTPFSFLQTGISAISRLTGGKVHLIVNGKDESSSVFSGLKGVEITGFTGPHPAGNPGVHIHHLDPLNKGERVWVVNLQDIIATGRLFIEGVYYPERIIALAGSEVIKPRYYRMLSGASVASVATGNIKEGNVRYISGNILTGTKISPEGFLGYYDSQVTVIPEGNHHEFLGWASPGFDKFSFYRVFLSTFSRAGKYRLDTNLHGGERAFVVTGQYEQVVPMDIYPMQLLKAIIARDIDGMENLGIYEVAEEDFALCEFICPSKIEIQSIIRDGIEFMMKEMS
jgi:Na+-transporting NADH:ubiquinone oxidoreductase subunit A